MDFHQLLITIVTVVAVIVTMMGLCGYLILLERKVSAYMQDRIGPNRVGPKGLLQPIADTFKFLLKEDIIPFQVDRMLFLVAPAIAMSTAMLAFVVVPFGPTTPPPIPPPPLAATESALAEYEQAVEEYRNTFQFVIAPNIDVGIVLIFAITSLTVYAIILGGWSSNSKYSFIGALRSSAQLISYEIPMGMSILGVVLITGSLNLERIISHQVAGGWNIWFQPLGFLLFLTSAFAECNRLPFDLPEAEQELVGGYHTEYSAMKFAMFFLGEYTHMVTTSFLVVTLFFGGWHFPGIPDAGWLAVALKLLVFMAKMSFFIVFYMLIRWTLPRFRFDQLMGVAWRVLIPLALANLVCVMVVKHVMDAYSLNYRWLWLMLPLSLALLLSMGILAVRGQSPSRENVLKRSGYADSRI
jgi:NADH-quinone oxidoreductase subunit H